MSTFGLLLKTYRERINLSQNDLAIKAGLSASTISRIEGGSRGPLGKRRQILALAKALDLQQGEVDTLLSAADLAPSTAPEMSLHPRDETLYRLAQELRALRSDPQVTQAQVRFVEESLLLVLRGARAALPAVDLTVLSSGAPAARTLTQEERYLDDLLGDFLAEPTAKRTMPFTVLAAVARSPHWELKRRLAEALPALLERQVDVERTVALVDAMRIDPPDPTWRTDIRRRVIEALPALWQIDPARTAPLLHWQEGDEVYAGLAMLDALADIGPTAPTESVREGVLKHASETDRQALVIYAALLDNCTTDPTAALESISAHRESESRLVRICIARALYHLLPARPAETLKWMRTLMRRQDNRAVEHQNVRRALTRHLDSLVALLDSPYDEPVLDLLQAFAGDEDVHIRRAVCDTLPDLATQAPDVALDLIEDALLQDRDHFIHERTWATLRRLMNNGSERAEELCAQLIEIA